MTSRNAKPPSAQDDDFARCKGEEHLEPAEVARRNLMDGLQRGALSIAEAEEKARSLDIPPLNSDPDPAEFDPMKLPTWTVAMVLAWIMWGTADDVRRHWTEYRAECREWKQFKFPVPSDGSAAAERCSYQLEQLEPRVSSFSFLQDDELIQRDRGNAPAHSAEEAKRLLWRALRADQLKMTAIDLSSGKSIAIPNVEFDHLAIPEHFCGEEADALHLRSDRVAYDKPRLGVEDMRRCWRSALDSGCINSQVQSPELQLNLTKLTPSFQKIANALAEEKAEGGTIDGLRPMERNARLIKRMEAKNLKGNEIPHERTFREFFKNDRANRKRAGEPVLPLAAGVSWEQ